MKSYKLLLIIFGLTIAVFLLEISLRSAAFIYRSYRINNKKNAAVQGAETLKILCLGDSFTFGLGAESGHDYPSQLEKLLNDNYQDKEFIVYNGGIPGQNSSMLLRKLVCNIKLYTPDIIILLIGSNNRTILEGSNYYLFNKGTAGKLTNFLLRLDISLSKLRSYKLIKISLLNLADRFQSGGTPLKENSRQQDGSFQENPGQGEQKKAGEREDGLKLIRVLCNERRFSEAENIIKERIREHSLRNKDEYILLSDIYCGQAKYDSALSILEEYILNDPKEASILFNLGRVYYMRGRTDPITREEDFKHSLKALQDSLLYAASDDSFFRGEVYINLAQLHIDEGKAQLARKIAIEALKCSPKNQFYKQILAKTSEGYLTEEENENFEELLYYDLGQIINLCRLYNIKIILLNYPHEGNGGIRKEIADKHKVQFIDIASKFTELLSQYKYNELFFADVHPNAIGYKFMAETVFEALKNKIGASP